MSPGPRRRPVIEPSVQGALPDSLFGFPIIVEQAMPASTAAGKAIAFGNFRAGYVIRDALPFSVLRLDERYAEFYQRVARCARWFDWGNDYRKGGGYRAICT